MNPLTIAKVAVEITDLKMENAELRGFVETVASHSAAPGSWMKRLIDEANELLAKIDKRL